MEEILNIFNQIAATNSRNEKENLFEQFKDNLLFKDILKFVYDPYILSGISSKKISKKVKVSLEFDYDLESIEEVMKYLKEHNTGRDSDIANIQDFILRQPENQRELITQIVTKSLKLGFTSNTLNKVYGDFIPSFDVMLADKYFAHPEAVKGEFILSQKLDGTRCVLLKEENGDIKVFSRQGQPIEQLVEILEDAKQLQPGYVYDGELILRNDNGLASKDLFSLTIKEVRKDGEKRNLILNCFDMLPINDFKRGQCNLPCSFRKDLLNKDLYEFKLEHIIEVPILYQGEDKEQIIKLLDEQIVQEHEGVMINISNAPYLCKRTRNILKVKKFNDADVKVLDILEGTGTNIGKLGAITIQFTDNGLLHQCNCGSGFSKEERIKYWEHPELILNKIVTIGYFEVSNNQKGGTGLRFPTWKSIIREDKTEISMY
ncbi:hypothetical protein [Clostridium sp.]|uniref:ATP-dependent DNA ligase n=1 Tax=Clostridium sp. TaxID=1506 RepID=UPI001A61F440|nr:hypothetical protein [Clostridium sp.]MBK5242131.1 hypothetical protein [Clostridium sp.]